MTAIPSAQEESGFTLVELLVAMAISTVIAIAAVAALTASRTGFSSADAASQLRDNGRFVSDLIQRLGGQLGYRDVEYVTKPRVSLGGAAANPRPDVYGFNNAYLSATPLDTGTTWTGGSVGDGSDILILSFQVSKMYPEVVHPAPDWNKADKSVIDCSGNTPDLVKAPTAAEPIPKPNAETDRDSRLISILHVAVSEGEPTLMCSRSTDNGVTFTTQPLIQGVENFQVLYGTDGVTAGAAPTLPADTVPDSYLRADQLTVAGDPVGTYANWRRVRSLRVGMVLRAKPGSSQDLASGPVYPFGKAKSSTGVPGGALNSADTADRKTLQNVPLPDGRLRQVVTFTVYLHNQQEI